MTIRITPKDPSRRRRSGSRYHSVLSKVKQFSDQVSLDSASHDPADCPASHSCVVSDTLRVRVSVLPDRHSP